MLYIIPTPLGNLGDLTQRAIKALREVRGIYCEDTRRTRQLLSHLDIHVPLYRYREHPSCTQKILESLRRGEDLALATDGGTPVISDPGLGAVAAARKEGLGVTVLPGPCALISAVAGSGLPGDSFVFLGFLPRSPSRQRKALSQAAALNRTVVLYESPYRVAKLLARAEEVFGPQAQAAVAREMTKLHEEWITGTLESVRAAVEAKGVLLGECCVVLHPASASNGRIPI